MFYSVGGVAHVTEFGNRFILYNKWWNMILFCHLDLRSAFGRLSKVCFEVDLFARELIIMIVVFENM